MLKKIEMGSRLVWYVTRENRKNLFVQFARPNGAIIFCRTFKNYFGQFVWIEKKKSHYISRVSLHEAPTKNSHWVGFELASSQQI